MRHRYSRGGGPALVAELEQTPPPPWEAQAQEFCAGGIGVNTVLILRPDPNRSGGTPDAEPFPPLFVLVLDEPAYRVAPELQDMFDMLALAGAARPNDRPQPDATAEWSVLDGSDPLVKFSMSVRAPVVVDAELVLFAPEVGPVLHTAVEREFVGLLPGDRLPLLPERGALEDALSQLVFIPTRRSPQLTLFLQRYGWWPA